MTAEIAEVSAFLRIICLILTVRWAGDLPFPSIREAASSSIFGFHVWRQLWLACSVTGVGNPTSGSFAERVYGMAPTLSGICKLQCVPSLNVLRFIAKGTRGDG